MATKEFSTGQVILSAGQKFAGVYLIVKGRAIASLASGQIIVERGELVGTCDVFTDTYTLTYTAAEDSILIPYPASKAGLYDFLRENIDLVDLLITSAFKQLSQLFELYRRTLDLFETPPTGPMPQWMPVYYSELESVYQESKDLKPAFHIGILQKAGHDARGIIGYTTKMDEYLLAHPEMEKSATELATDAAMGVAAHVQAGADSDSATLGDLASIEATSQAGKTSLSEAEYDSLTNEQGIGASEGTSKEASKEGSNQGSYLASDFPSELNNSLMQILSYAGIDEDSLDDYTQLIDEYIHLKDKSGSDEAPQRLRAALTKLFYKLYREVFFASIDDTQMPAAVKMFLSFGYLDETLAGLSNATYLYSIVNNIPTDPSLHVYTLYEWLLAIYNGEVDASRNEFDTDYASYLHELKVNGTISAKEEAAALADREKQVIYELENMFVSVNKVTYGRVTTFCPIFSEHNIVKPLPAMLQKADNINQLMTHYSELDFKSFSRDVIYTNDVLGITKEYISVNVMPNIILMPNVGVRGIMWQEIEGRKRTTPARFMFPLFCAEDIRVLILRVIAEYRWEMCKRVQGARWNDVTDPSLTSEYFDYIQFYRKNKDLSPEAKEKIRTMLLKGRNSPREVFVMDYMQWVLYESEGNPRLNKISRAILFKYCPFNAASRSKLQINPLYHEMMDRYKIKQAQQLHRMDNLFTKIRNAGKNIPPELLKQKSYLEK